MGRLINQLCFPRNTGGVEIPSDQDIVITVRCYNSFD